MDALPALAPRDRAAAHRLAAAVLRRMGTLDAVLEPFLRKEPPEPVRHVLRLGAAGLLLLDTPRHAAVATAVALARARGLAPFAGLVNAVLRRVAEAGRAALADLDAPRLDTPAWLWTSWGDNAREIALAHQHEAPLDVTLRPGGELPGGYDAADGLTALPRRNPRRRDRQALTTVNSGCRTPPPLCRLGCSLRSLASAWRISAPPRAARRRSLPLPAQRLSPSSVTLCAWNVYSDNLRHWHLQADLVQADAAAWDPGRHFDAVLLDAPCSATGTIRRHPDVPHLKRPRDVRALAATQDRLLRAAAIMLRKGGRLIYSVCSLQPEECVPRVEAAVAGGDLRHDRFTPQELAALPEALTQEGFLRTLPSMWAERGGMDGFFAARLIKT